MRRAARLALALAVTLGLAPGTLVRTDTGLRSDPATITIAPIPIGTPPPGPLRLIGAWQIRSQHGWVGGFSALVADGQARLISASDRAFRLDIDISHGDPRVVPGGFRFIGRRYSGRRELLDLESLARDPASGTLWAGYENHNLIERFAPDGTRRSVEPPAMKDWDDNSGPETMVRLRDGRFLVIAEGEVGDDPVYHPALLFADDPVEGGEPMGLALEGLDGFDPVDATQLPDGRVLILLRHVEYFIPARFTAAIAIADPATIRRDMPWRARIIQHLPGSLLAENFEGITFIPAPDNPRRGAVWLIADDNLSMFQRSLLVRFDWAGQASRTNEKAPGKPDA
jgi:hypothetical protein